MSRSITPVSASLPGAPAARKVGWLAAFKAQRCGSRDAGGPSPDSSTGHLPYTLRLQGRAAAAESVISQALHAQIAVIDRDFVSASTRIAHHHQAAGRLESERADIPDDNEVGSLAAAQADRDHDRLRTDLAGHKQTGTDLASRVAGLLAARRHLVDEARALVGGHAARFTELAACHRRGYERRARRGPTAGAITLLPTFQAASPWVTGDMPILIAAIDPATRRVIDWAIQEFDRPAHVAELRVV